MKSNVDLTTNNDFRETSPPENGTSFWGMFRHLPETHQYIEDGVKNEYYNYDNPDAKKEFVDFITGRTLVATGSRHVRNHKLEVRGCEMGETCWECGKVIRKPWGYCPCMEVYFVDKDGLPIKDSCQKQLKYPEII